MTETAPLAERLTDLVASVPGVVQIYPSRSGLARVLDALPLPSDPGVKVSISDDAVSVEASIEVTDEEPATDVCRRVHAAIQAHLVGTEPTRLTTIDIQVARID